MKHYAHYGDGLADVNIDDTVAFHQGHGKLATLTATRPASTYILMNVPHSPLSPPTATYTVPN